MYNKYDELIKEKVTSPFIDWRIIKSIVEIETEFDTSQFSIEKEIKNTYLRLENSFHFWTRENNIERTCFALASYKIGYLDIVKASGRVNPHADFADVMEALPGVIGANPAADVQIFVKNVMLNYLYQVVSND
jgi:hypothetical protein